MTWKDITVLHMQTIRPFIKDQSLSDLERDIKILMVLTGKTEAELDRMSFHDFNVLRSEMQFLHDQNIPAEKIRYIHTPKQVFKVCYDARRIPIARYVEMKHFLMTEDAVVANLHRLTASMVIPVKKQRRFFRDRYVPEVYDASRHSEYAEQLQDARFTDVYYPCVFFCNLYTNWILNSQDYLAHQMMIQGMDMHLAQQQARLLYDAMAGFITSNRLPNMKVLL